MEQPLWQELKAKKMITLLEPMKCVEWAQAEDLASRNRLIKLLKRNLEQHCVSLGAKHKLAYSKDLKCYLFQATPGKTRGSITTHAISKSGSREVFKAIINKMPGKEGETQHWQQQAFRHQFVTFGGQWFINIVPFWAFTCDGMTSPSRWHDRSSKNMRKPERNRAVLGHVLFWASVLCREPDLLKSTNSIRIHRPESIMLAPSIRDTEWMNIAPVDERQSLESDLGEELLLA